MDHDSDEEKRSRGLERNAMGDWVKDVTPDPDSLARKYMREDGTTYDGFWNPAGRRCFVATSAFENNQEHPTVETLRAYRDLVLLETVAGRLIDRAYYDWHLGEIGAVVLDQLPRLGKPLVRAALSAYARFIAEPAISKRLP